MKKPKSLAVFFIHSSLWLTLKPGIDSSLSRVPPVKPRLLPLIFKNLYPIEASIGPSIRLTLSPTPPVECLSSIAESIPLKSTYSPLSIIALVK